MGVVESGLIWFTSFVVFLMIFYFNYKISYKLGIKKALYRTTYIVLCIIFAFVLAPVITNRLFDLDLKQFDIVLRYKDQEFYTIVDYVEEVIVHSPFLNDLYTYFPSLKDLFMDFPQILLIPITYLLLFLIISAFWLPLYLYLSYKRKRRILYEREDKKSHRIWAGLLGGVQGVFFISVLFSPLNGLNRIYQNSINNTLDDEYSSLCEGRSSLEKYSLYCDIIETYDSTFFANIGGNDTLSNYMFDSLTRISYDEGHTSFAKEASLIVKSGIVLNQSNLLESIESNDEIISLSVLVENDLTESDIDIIVNTLSNSKYSGELLDELLDLATNTLSGFMRQILDDKQFAIKYELSKDDLVEEAKIALNVLTFMSNKSLVNDLIEAKKKIDYFSNEIPSNRKTQEVIFDFLIDVLSSADMDDFEQFCEYLFESRIFNKAIPYIMDSLFGIYGLRFVSTNSDVLDQFYNVVDFSRLLLKYRENVFTELMTKLNDDELLLMGEIFENIAYSEESKNVIYFILGLVFKDFSVHYPSDFLMIQDWEREIFVFRDVCHIINYYKDNQTLDYNMINKLLANKESELVAIFYKILKSNASFLLGQLIIGAQEG